MIDFVIDPAVPLVIVTLYVVVAVGAIVCGPGPVAEAMSLSQV